ncbi:hypothetical protein WN55_01759, partial [Dufourea novaeangliae]
LGGKIKLTEQMIDKLSVYYGLAIRRNCHSVEQIYSAIRTTYFHYSYDHSKCPIRIESWCTWQRASANGELRYYKHDYKALPQDVLHAIKPIYVDLTRPELFERCFGGFNQNNNESYNQLIWKISPKILPSGLATVELAAHISACMFNEGSWGILQIYAAMVIKCGSNIHLQWV